MHRFQVPAQPQVVVAQPPPVVAQPPPPLVAQPQVRRPLRDITNIIRN